MMRIPMLALIASLFAGPVAAQDVTVFTLGSGDVTGSYYAAASAICSVVNRAERGKLRCSPDPTAGSIYNLEALRDGQLDFALVQSDLQSKAFDGSGPFAEAGPMPELRSVMGLYRETLAIVARPDKGIASFKDLTGKRIDIGLPASGRHATVERVMIALDYATSDFHSVAELPAGVAISSVCDGSIDATMLVMGHPNAALARAIKDCGAILVPLDAQERARILADSSDLRPSVIRSAAYPGLASDVSSIAVTATLVTRADVDPLIVEAVVRDVIGNLEPLAFRAPVLAGMDVNEMRKAGQTAPLHPGAAAAFDAAVPAN